MILERYVLNESEFSDVDSVLRRRGHDILRTGSRSSTLAPSVDVTESELASELSFEFSDPRYTKAKQYLDCFEKRNCRNLLKTLVEAPGQKIEIKELENKHHAKVLDSYVPVLESIGVIRCTDGTVTLARKVDNLGPSFEQYVAEICARDLRGSSEWGVKLRKLPKAGGDFDVLAWLEPSLVYIECKSGDPNNIDQRHIANYLQREFELAADISIFLIDTTDKLDGFVLDKFDPVIKIGLGSKSSHATMLPLNGYEGVFGGYRNVFITNSKPSVLRQIQRCLQAYYALMRPRLVPPPKPGTNFPQALVQRSTNA